MAVTLTDSDIAALGPQAREQIRGETPKATPAEPKAEAKPKAEKSRATERGKVGSVGTPNAGASDRTRGAAEATRKIWRATGSGRTPTANGGNFGIRPLIWLFVWLGVLFYLVANPRTLPTLVDTVFAPVKGVLNVAHGVHVAAAKVA